ncbi:MAG: N-acetylmuramic acid 6-phosphate etherase [Phycisphaerales bacterium]|jgi:N-acetylmuramic acid 6-phosphate etherase|nr:N-acetylmuramic acid 6-phosphate etherase [Phycisphaerales bacterium]
MSEPALSPSVPDRGRIDTEQRNIRADGLDRADVRGCLDLLTGEDFAAVNAVRSAQGALEAFIRAVAAPGRFSAEGGDGGQPMGGRLIYVGAGTSGRLGVLDASEAPPTFCVPPGRIIGIIAGGDGALRVSSEGKEDDLRGAEAELRALGLTDRDSVLAIAAGGTTPYALGAMMLAKELAPGCVTGLLTCSRVAWPAACDHLIVLATGPEVLTGSTRLKAGTATKLALNAISTTLMVQAGRVHENLMVDVKASNAKLRDRAARVISQVTGVGRDEAMTLLDAAGGSAKVAIVMQQLGVTAAEARAKIARHGPRLRDVLGEA